MTPPVRFAIAVVFILALSDTFASPIDNHVTSNTRQLYKVLSNFTHDSNKIMFGQHGATLHGAYNGHTPYSLGTQHNGTHGWTFTNTQAIHNSADELCDMKSITGEYPAFVEFDLKNLDPSTLKTTAYLIQRAADRKQVISVSWHMPNPITNASFYVRLDHTGINTTHQIRRLLPGGDTSLQFNASLNIAADWFKGLRYSNGNQASVIFRPFHEMTINSFWWGTNKKQQNTPADYKHLYQYVVHYMRDVKHVHNVLYAFSPSKPTNRADYLKFYPGNAYVDILGLDFYYRHPFEPSLQTFKDAVKVVADLAMEKHKIAALTEVGIQNYGLDAHPNFWVDHILNPLKSGNGTSRIAYMATWDNFCSTHCEVRIPYHGHPAASSFLDFFRDPVTVFESSVNQFVSQIVG